MTDNIQVTAGLGTFVRTRDTGSGVQTQSVAISWHGPASVGTVETLAITRNTSAANNLVLKASAGVLFECNATSPEDGWLLIFDATSAPGDGTVQPVLAIPVPASGTNGLSCSGLPPYAFSTGITAVFSTTGPFTLTKSATAFFWGRAA